MDCIWVNLKNVVPHVFQIYGMSVYTFLNYYHYMYQNVIYTASWKVILSCYVATILQMKDSWFVNLTFKAHN